MTGMFLAHSPFSKLLRSTRRTPVESKQLWIRWLTIYLVISLAPGLILVLVFQRLVLGSDRNSNSRPVVDSSVLGIKTPGTNPGWRTTRCCGSNFSWFCNSLCRCKRADIRSHDSLAFVSNVFCEWSLLCPNESQPIYEKRPVWIQTGVESSVSLGDDGNFDRFGLLQFDPLAGTVCLPAYCNPCHPVGLEV